MKSNQPVFYFASAEEAETAFYSAFEMGDVQLMDAVLARQNVSCIHPGSLPIIGREAVLDSWSQILNNLATPVFYTDVLSRSVVDDMTIHLVMERIASSHQPDAEISLVLATNVYVREKQGWRLQMHHAVLPPVAQEADDSQQHTVTHDAPTTLQ